MALATLKPRLSTARLSRVQTPAGTPRQRGWAWLKRRSRWLSEHPLCVHCEKAGHVRAAQEVDHVVPLWKGGADDDSNIQGLCTPCHAAKTAAEATERGM